MTAKQRRFIAEYLVNPNATQAAIKAGYSLKTAYKIGSENLSKPPIQAVIAEQQASQLAHADVAAVRVLQEAARIGFVDMRSFLTPDGRLKEIHEWTAEQGAAVASVEVIKKNAEAGDGHIDVIHKLKLWDKPKALDLLARHLGLLVPSVDINVHIDLDARLDAGRLRVAKAKHG